MQLNSMSNHDWRREEIAADKAPTVYLSYSMVFSLYQHLIRLSKLSLETESIPTSSAWSAAASRVSQLSLSLGPLNFFEVGSADARTVEEFQERLKQRTNFFVQEMVAAMEDVEEDYRYSLWTEHRELLAEALKDLRGMFAPQKDRLLIQLSDWFNIRSQPESYSVYLVPDCHEPTGGYSHPTVISVSKFKSLDLIEVILHELTHVMAHHNRTDSKSAFRLIEKRCTDYRLPIRVALELFHLLIFHASGALIREVYGTDYVPYARRRKIYARTSTILRTNLSEEVVEIQWNDLVQGKKTMEDIVAFFVKATNTNFSIPDSTG